MNQHIQNYYDITLSYEGWTMEMIHNEMSFYIQEHYFYCSPRLLVLAKPVNADTDTEDEILEASFISKDPNCWYINFMSGFAADIFDIPHDFKPEKFCFYRHEEMNYFPIDRAKRLLTRGITLCG